MSIKYKIPQVLDPMLQPRLKETSPEPFVASIEVGGKFGTFIHPYHLGIDIRMAKPIVEKLFEACRLGHYNHVPKKGVPQQCTTIALLKHGEMFDVWDGRDWFRDVERKRYEDEEKQRYADELKRKHKAELKAVEDEYATLSPDFLVEWGFMKEAVQRDKNLIASPVFGAWATKYQREMLVMVKWNTWQQKFAAELAKKEKN